MKAKILLTTVHKPLGIESGDCTRNIQAELYNTQVTKCQGIFSIRAICTGWGLEYIAQNLDTPVTVMHYPTLNQFRKELRKGYDYIGIGFNICTYPKALELISVIRSCSPGSSIVLGGYGTVIEDCDHHADHVCREEGINFFRKLLGKPELDGFKIPVIMHSHKVLGMSTKPELVLPVGLGCSRGCDFCGPSHFHDRAYIPLVRSGRDIHQFIRSVDFGSNTRRGVGIIDEDFLLDIKRGRELAELNPRLADKPVMFSCLTSLKSLAQYTDAELLNMGLAGAWVGVESRSADYPKFHSIDVPAQVTRLKALGINVLCSMILGYDWHTPDRIEDDFSYLLSLKPTLSQYMLLSPCPRTPLHEKLQAEGRLLSVPYQYYDGFHLLFRHPHYSPEELEKLLQRLFEREFEELGPCVFRVLEVQLDGYQRLNDSSIRLYRRRALEHFRNAETLYPLLKLGIVQAPSPRVRSWLIQLRSRASEIIKPGVKTQFKEVLVPAINLWNRLGNMINPIKQPPLEINRYHWPQ